MGIYEFRSEMVLMPFSKKLLLAGLQKQELEWRYQLFQQGEQELHDWQEVHEELKADYNEFPRC